MIRVNSQSGKGGVAYVLKADYGLDLPRGLQIEFSKRVQEVTDRTGKEVTSAGIWSLFEETYLRRDGIQLADYSIFPEPRAPERRRIAATILIDGEERQVEGVGNGPIAAFVDALQRECDIELTSSTIASTRSARGPMRRLRPTFRSAIPVKQHSTASASTAT